MHFKRLEIVGFKSFASKTVIEFEPGVTAIVGPNGCGKSNVSDAIRWVIGEQSAKSLRGSSMEDVIFNGSADEEPLNLAEVSLFLDNSARLLAVDYEEVVITRRLYRSGESEYLLNKNVVRLKDIHEMLLGTGIGTESYSVIEQGKMDTILNAKPDERRVIFEEAAGITKFKAKKKEALRKLEQTDANLLRINDIVQEVKRQISSVERQAKKAEQYKIEFEKMKQLELGAASQEFLLFEDDRRQKEEALDALKREEFECLSVVQAIESKCQAERVELHRAEDALSKASGEEVWAAAEIRKNQDRILLNRERMGELAERRGSLTGQIEGAKKRLEELDTEAQKLVAEFEAAQAEERTGEEFLRSVQGEFDAIEQRMREVRQDEQAVHEAVSQSARRKSQCEHEIAKVRSELSSLQHQRKRLVHEEENWLKEVQKIDERLTLPLFEQGGQQAFSGIQAKVREFRERMASMFKDWLGRGLQTLGQDEETVLEREIERFSDEVGKLQGTVDAREIENRHLRESRRKAEEKLARIDEELKALESEEIVLNDKERQQQTALLEAEANEQAAQSRVAEGQGAREERQREKDAMLVRLAETRSQYQGLAARREKAERDKVWIVQSRRSQEDLLQGFEREAEESVSKKQALEEENVRLEAEQVTLSASRDEVLGRLEGLRRDRQAAAARLAENENERAERAKFLDEAKEKVHAFQMQSAEIRFSIDRLKERIFNAYQIDLALQQEGQEAEGEARQMFALPEGMELEQAKAEIARYREKLSKMGPVNLVAIEEHEEMTQRYNFLTQQQEDLLKAKEDLHKAIQKINRTTRELFAETFAKVQTNFSDYYRLLFNGGQAELVLQDEQDILESGIEIVARPPGKKLQNITLLSGGEKALTAVALLFALFKVKPSPFCVLDEIDAPLDETNVDRFCGVLKEFIQASQFILITHNKRTMNLADAIYGVTMERTGISRIVSVKFNTREKVEVR